MNNTIEKAMSKRAEKMNDNMAKSTPFNNITWSNKKDKVVICKHGNYFSLTESELNELHEVTGSIIAGSEQFYQNDSRKLEGEVTPETVLSQCDRMNNENMEVNFSYHGKMSVFVISAFMPGVVEPFYFESHYKTMESKSLAEIYQDLIKIQEGE